MFINMPFKIGFVGSGSVCCSCLFKNLVQCMNEKKAWVEMVLIS